LLWYVGERDYEPLELQLSDETKLARCYQLYLRLMSQCAGLLELRKDIDDFADFADFADTDTDMAQTDLHMVAIEEDTDLMRPEGQWSFSRYGIHSTVHYMHRTTRDFFAQGDIEELLRERLGKSRFDNYSWLATHAFVEYYEAHMRMKGIGEDNISSAVAYELQEKWAIFTIYRMNARNGSASLMLDAMSDGLGEDVSESDLASNMRADTPLLRGSVAARQGWLAWLCLGMCLAKPKPESLEGPERRVAEDLMDAVKVSQDLRLILREIDSM
jgi:hypothetical protein